MKNNRKSNFLTAVLFIGILMVWAVDAFTDGERNILWDGGFKTGTGNNCWAMERGNYGPNRRAIWKGDYVLVLQKLVSRLYWLEEGKYVLCAWVRRNPEYKGERKPIFVLQLTNFNYYRYKAKNQYQKKFVAPEGEKWQRVSLVIDVKNPVRNYFHVAIIPDAQALGSVEIKAVSLTKGDKLPEKMIPAAEVVAGFYIPEETCIYVSNEKRNIELIIHNNTVKPQKKKVTWEVFNHLEKSVKKGDFIEEWPAGKSVRKQLPLQKLPHEGYRLACSVEDEIVVGDALVAFLPKIDQEAFPKWGGDASINPRCVDFTGRWMKRLGAKEAILLSSGGCITRWSVVNPAPDKYVWQDQCVDQAFKDNLELIGNLGLKHPPKWVQKDFFKNGGYKIDKFDENGFLKIYLKWVKILVEHYGKKIPIVFLDDEVHGQFPGEKGLERLARIYSETYKVVKAAAKAQGFDILYGVNATYPKWWGKFLKKVPVEQVDYVACNSVCRPYYSEELLNIVRDLKFTPIYYYTFGVGQKGPFRKTSLILDRASTSANPAGLFAWQAISQFWLSRPYGYKDKKYGPEVRFCYYDLRVLGQCIYLPIAGKTGVEYNNCPNLGMQAIAMSKYQLQNKYPVRDPKEKYSLKGSPMKSERMFAYPFRDDKDAVIVLMTTDSRNLDSRWEFSGMDFSQLKPTDFYQNPLDVEKDGGLKVVELPVYLHIKADKLKTVLTKLKSVKSEIGKTEEQCNIVVGKYSVSVDPDRKGLIRILKKEKDKTVEIINFFSAQPAFPKPKVRSHSGRKEGRIDISFSRTTALGINISDRGVVLKFKENNFQKKTVKRLIRFRLGQEGAGHDIVIQEDSKVTAGKLREDYGKLYPAKKVPEPEKIGEFTGFVRIKGYADFNMPGAEGVGYSPKTGFKWGCRDGEAFIEAEYEVGPIKKKGVSGKQYLGLSLLIQ